MMELESVGDENFESWSEGTPNFYGFCISVCFNFFAFLTISTVFLYIQFPSVSGSFCSTWIEYNIAAWNMVLQIEGK